MNSSRDGNNAWNSIRASYHGTPDGIDRFCHFSIEIEPSVIHFEGLFDATDDEKFEGSIDILRGQNPTPICFQFSEISRNKILKFTNCSWNSIDLLLLSSIDCKLLEFLLVHAVYSKYTTRWYTFIRFHVADFSIDR